jgi:hypothetical protein
METILAALIAAMFYVPIGLLVILDIAGVRLGRYDDGNELVAPGA